MSTKYLLNLVESRPRQASHLKALVAEARESGVRDEKANFHEFVETLERITNELRADVNATAFLSRVKKTEAPDYYDVVKNPMDLGTVLKNVRQGKYKTKSQYKNDVDLIWSNCLHYNTAPQHPLRLAAISLRTRVGHLLDFVTDPTTSKPNSSSHPTLPKTPLATIRLPALAAAENKWEGTIPNLASGALGPKLGTSKERLGNGKAVNGKVNGVAFADARSAGGTDDGNAADGARTGDESSSGTKEPGIVKFCDRPALARSSDAMRKFEEIREEWLDVGHETGAEMDGPIAGPSMPRGLINGYSNGHVNGNALMLFTSGKGKEKARSVDPSDSDVDPSDLPPVYLTSTPLLSDWAPFLRPSMIASGLPPIPFCASSDEGKEIERTGRKRKRGYGNRNGRARKRNDKGKEKGELVMKTSMGLREQITANIAALREVKKVREKICVLGDAPRPGMNEDEPLADDEPPDPGTEDIGKGFTKEVFESAAAAEAGYSVMQQVVSGLLAHSGFDAVHPTALSTLTEVASHYLLNTCRTLSFYSDRFGRKVPPSDIILQTLRQMGVQNLGTLDSYVVDDVGRYGGKIGDLLRKLQGTYQDVLDGVGGEAVGDEQLFANDGEAMIMGEFTNELGEDFFGLKDLGLDTELKMSNLRIPARLFHGRPKVAEAAADVEMSGPEPEPRFVCPAPFIPLTTTAIEAQIGLLQPFYRARSAHPDFELLDDDQVAKLPKIFRPKVPPSGKIPIKRRAIVAAAAPTPGDGAGSAANGAKGKEKKDEKPVAKKKKKKVEAPGPNPPGA